MEQYSTRWRCQLPNVKKTRGHGDKKGGPKAAPSPPRNADDHFAVALARPAHGAQPVDHARLKPDQALAHTAPPDGLICDGTASFTLYVAMRKSVLPSTGRSRNAGARVAAWPSAASLNYSSQSTDLRTYQPLSLPRFLPKGAGGRCGGKPSSPRLPCLQCESVGVILRLRNSCARQPRPLLALKSTRQ
jgi:hypothetical protein